MGKIDAGITIQREVRIEHWGEMARGYSGIRSTNGVAYAGAESPKPAVLATPGPEFQIRCSSSFRSLSAHRDEWDRLVERTGGDLFGTFEWCSTWWRHFGENRALRIYTAWDGDQLVGVLPMFDDTLRWGPISLRWMRSVGSDYAGARSCWCVTEPWTGPVAERLYADFLESGCDLLYLGEWPGYFEAAANVAEQFRKIAGPSDVVHTANYYPHAVFDLAASVDDYIAALSPSERSNIRKSLRRLEGTPGASFERVALGDFDRQFSSFITQHETLWAEQGRLGFFRDWPGSEAFHRDLSLQLATQGRLYLLRFAVEKETLGYEFAYSFGRRVHMFQSSRSTDTRWTPLSPGRLLHCELVKQSIAAGIRQIDALSGYYEFKRRLGAKFIGLQSVAILAPTRLSRLRCGAFRHVTCAMEAAYFRAWFWRIAPWMRRRMPHLSTYFPGSTGLLGRFVHSRLVIPALVKNSRPFGIENGD